MDNPRNLDVADWQDSPMPTAISRASARRWFFPPALIGILGTLLLHAALIQSVSVVSRSSRPKPPESQESGTLLSKATEEADNLVLISLPMIASGEAASPISSLPDLSKMKIKTSISADPPALLDLETLALSEDQSSNSSAGETDGAELARLFGIYTGQIQARIDRVWRRPRSPVSEDEPSQSAKDPGESFQCEAQIVQDIGGNVREILLPRCNGSPAWHKSLVLAIQQASPLPAPPRANLFRSSITLSFVALAYGAGSSDEEYEIVPRQLAQADGRP